MQKAFNVGEKLFFDVLIICLVSFIYFKIVPMNEITFSIGILICTFYFGVNFYTGYKYNLTTTEALFVGIMGCGVGIFLSFFAIYMHFVLQSHNGAILIAMPYIIPTTPIIKLFIKELSIVYVFELIFINVFLVIFGSFIRKIMNKLGR